MNSSHAEPFWGNLATMLTAGFVKIRAAMLTDTAAWFSRPKVNIQEEEGKAEYEVFVLAAVVQAV